MKTLNNYYIMIYDKMTILKYPVFSQILRKKAFKNWLQCKRSVLAGGEQGRTWEPTDKTLRLVRQANLNGLLSHKFAYHRIEESQVSFY